MGWIAVDRSFVYTGLLATTLKEHEPHHAEREWRFVQMRDRRASDIHFRTTAEGRLAPYYEIDVSASITEIGLGAKHPAGALADWNEWLRRHHREKDVSVWRSSKLLTPEPGG